MRQGSFLIALFDYNSIDIYKREQYFSEIFWMIWRTGIKFYTLEFSNLLQLLNNQLCQVYGVSFFERMIKVELKMVYINYQKLVFLVILSFHIIIKGPGTSFQSPALSRKHVCYKILLNFILTVLRRRGSRGWTSGKSLTPPTLKLNI